MAQDLGDKISDEQLRDIIQRLQSERNEHGNIIEMNHIFQSLPLENEGSVDNKSAVDIIRAAIDIAVYKRLSHIDS
jgi:benzoyl-CoA reductase/2-hydroxyglutaryl-CoA dehydratase subunit BcrC/BadD/HgdB